MRQLLFVCSRNKIRSLTAEKLFAGDDRYAVRSRGTEKSARIRLTAGDVGWAEVIFAMEKRHAERIRAKFRAELGETRLVTLFIKDAYVPMQPALIAVLREKLAEHLELPG